ncbi:hypothetical protein E6P97_01840 [Patescibacteria group bacterium]|nr:MAG: hypothetical protein E6P97_01840 [Patescibacteria group bacterium]
MTTTIKKLIAGSLALAAVAIIPATTFAATETEETIVNALIGSSISISSATGVVNVNVTPVVGGSQSSASDTVTVATNNSTGYTLTLADNDADTNLNSGGNTIAAHAGVHAAPTALANNTWGYAIPGGNFDVSYSALNNVTSSGSLWAGVPVSSAPVTLKTTATTTGGDATTVWYSVKADTTKPNGTYTDTVVYTATTNAP